MTVEPDAARPAHRTGASIAETCAPDLAPRPAARASRDGSVRRHTAIAMRPDGASYAPVVPAEQPTLALLAGLLPSQAGTGPLSTHTGKGEAAAAAPTSASGETVDSSPPAPRHAAVKTHDATARIAALNNRNAQRAQPSRRAGVARHARTARDTRRDQQASDPLDALRRMLHASWWHAPPRRNRLDSSRQYKGQ